MNTRDVWAAIALDGMPNLAVVHYGTKAPNGVGFTEQIAAFQVNPDPGAQTPIEGFPMPLAIDPAHVINGKMVLAVKIAISGTDFQRHPYPGTWSIHFKIDGVPSADTTAAFDLRMGQ